MHTYRCTQTERACAFHVDCVGVCACIWLHVCVCRRRYVCLCSCVYVCRNDIMIAEMGHFPVHMTTQSLRYLVCLFLSMLISYKHSSRQFCFTSILEYTQTKCTRKCWMRCRKPGSMKISKACVDGGPTYGQHVLHNATEGKQASMRSRHACEFSCKA